MNKREHLLNGAIVGGAIGALVNPLHLLVAIPLAAAGGLLPDADTHLGTHRKTFHNLPLLGILLLGAWFYPVFVYLPIGVCSHYMLDALCTRRGIALFYPISRQEYQSAGGVTVDDPQAGLATAGMSACQVALAVFLFSLIP